MSARPGTDRAGDTLHCLFCHQDADGLTLYSVAGAFRLMVCQACYGLLVAKEHQPHSKPMQRLRRVLWGSHKKEVVSDEGATALSRGVPSVVDGEAHRGALSAAVAAGGIVEGEATEVRTHGAGM
jgi:hypothetical protein